MRMSGAAVPGELPEDGEIACISGGVVAGQGARHISASSVR